MIFLFILIFNYNHVQKNEDGDGHMRKRRVSCCSTCSCACMSLPFSISCSHCLFYGFTIYWCKVTKVHITGLKWFFNLTFIGCKDCNEKEFRRSLGYITGTNRHFSWRWCNSWCLQQYWWAYVSGVSVCLSVSVCTGIHWKTDVFKANYLAFNMWHLCITSMLGNVWWSPCCVSIDPTATIATYM